MLRFVVRRAGLALVTLVLVSLILFAIAQVLPGDVGRTILGPYATNAQVAALDRQLGVDRPLIVRVLGVADRVPHRALGQFVPV